MLIEFTLCYEELFVELAAVGKFARPVVKPTDLLRYELTAKPFAGIYSTTELSVHIV